MLTSCLYLPAPKPRLVPAEFIRTGRIKSQTKRDTKNDNIAHSEL